MMVLKIVIVIMIICLITWGGILMWVIKRLDTIEDKIEQCEKITQNEYEMYTKMKTITEYYQMMLQEDDLK